MIFGVFNFMLHRGLQYLHVQHLTDLASRASQLVASCFKLAQAKVLAKQASTGYV